jgi:hypothetical protein
MKKNEPPDAGQKSGILESNILVLYGKLLQNSGFGSFSNVFYGGS